MAVPARFFRQAIHRQWPKLWPTCFPIDLCGTSGGGYRVSLSSVIVTGRQIFHVMNRFTKSCLDALQKPRQPDGWRRLWQFALQENASRLLAQSWRFYRAAQLPQRRSEEHTSELQSLMRSSYAVFCLKKKNIIIKNN